MMAQDNAAQPLLDLKSKIGEYARKFIGSDKPVSKGVVYAGDKPDTSYHDSMVKAANESFRRAAEKRRGTTLKGASSSGAKRRSKRKSTQRKPNQGK